MKKFLLIIALNFISMFTYSQEKVYISLVDEYEGQLITLYTDSIPAAIYYNFTGFETVSSIVLNVITVYNDGNESRKEFDVNSFSKDEENNTINVSVKKEDKLVRYIFYLKTNMILMISEGDNLLWSGDLFF